MGLRSFLFIPKPPTNLFHVIKKEMKKGERKYVSRMLPHLPARTYYPFLVWRKHRITALARRMEMTLAKYMQPLCPVEWPYITQSNDPVEIFWDLCWDVSAAPLLPSPQMRSKRYRFLYFSHNNVTFFLLFWSYVLWIITFSFSSLYIYRYIVSYITNIRYGGKLPISSSQVDLFCSRFIWRSFNSHVLFFVFNTLVFFYVILSSLVYYKMKVTLKSYVASLSIRRVSFGVCWLGKKQRGVRKEKGDYIGLGGFLQTRMQSPSSCGQAVRRIRWHCHCETYTLRYIRAAFSLILPEKKRLLKSCTPQQPPAFHLLLSSTAANEWHWVGDLFIYKLGDELRFVCGPGRERGCTVLVH